MNNREHPIIGDQSFKQEGPVSSYQTKQIAMIKWLLVKANRDLEDYKEIFQPLPNVVTSSKNFSSRLHPKIVNALQSAELYSAALANMNIDHHFYNPDHNRILQVLARKGVILSDPQLTVSVLLKSDPINLNAHLSVIEAIMILYAKEIATPDRIHAAIEKLTSQQRYSSAPNEVSVIQWKNIIDYDQLLLLWINEGVSALNKRIKQELSESQKNEINVAGDFIKVTCRELSDLSDGIALSAVVSFYCPLALPWRKIRIGKPINTADCVHNLNQFINACQSSLSYQICHVNPQDMLPHAINYMRPNVMALLADLFNVFEISPPRCVLPDSRANISATGSSVDFQTGFSTIHQVHSRKIGQTGVQKRPLHAIQQIFAIPNLRNYSTVQNGGLPSESRTANSSPKAERKVRNSLPDSQFSAEFFVVHKGRNVPTLSSINPDSNIKERQHEPVAAGKPSHWNDNRKNQMSGCGRRSRRNSFSDESQLTIENFGGSHENINLLGRNPDKEPAVHVVNTLSDNVIENNDGSRQLRSQVAAQENWSSAAITSVLCDNATENKIPFQNNPPEVHPLESNSVTGLAVTSKPSVETNEILESCKVSSQMLNIRLKLEEKRRQIEMEKRRMELNLKKQRQKLNKAAFLQAVSKMENGDGNKDNDGVGCCDELFVISGDGNGNSDTDDNIDHDSIVTCEDISQVEQRWLKDRDTDRNSNGDSSSRCEAETTESDSVAIEKYQKSISEMDSSLHAIQTDLQWLALKESEMLRNNSDTQQSAVENRYPVTFMLNQESQRTSPNQLTQRRTLMSQQNRAGDFYSNCVEDDVSDGRGNCAGAGNLPNQNLIEFNYGDRYGVHMHHGNAHHHSLISTMPAKSPLPAPNVPLPFSNPDVYAYQQQRSPLVLHTQLSPNFNGNNYRSMNIPNSCASDNKENQIFSHQVHNEHFYLHKPSDNAPFQFQSASPNAMNLNSSASSSTNTFAQRKTWDSQDDSANVSLQPTPPPRMYTSRYSPNKEHPTTLTTVFADNRLKSVSSSGSKSPHPDNSPAYFSSFTSKKNYSPMHDDGAINVNHDSCNLSETDSTARQASVGCMSIPSPSVDDMAPQCISFIGTSQESVMNEDCVNKSSLLNESVNKLNIVNGSRTYRIPSPTNKGHHRANSNHPFIDDDSKKEKGFYVSFSNDDDNETDNTKRFTERIKAPLRMKRVINNPITNSTKNDKLKVVPAKTKLEIVKRPETIYKDRDKSANDEIVESRLLDSPLEKIMEKASDDTIIIKTKKAGSANASSPTVGLLINANSNSNDPALVDEMERKKERILLLSLQRRQQQEEMKARKEIEAQRRKEEEKHKEELKVQKKEEEKRRRAVILEKHRLKKMIEESEREGKPIDKELLNAAMMANTKSSNMNGDCRSNALPKMRPRKQPVNARPRPKTIHIDMGSNMKENNGNSHHALTPTLTKKGSTTNLADHNNYGMSRRDYYRGSQDCLLAGADVGTTAGTSASSIYSDMTDEDRPVSAAYPMKNINCGSIGRRRGSSYKTSRDVSLDRATSRIARPKFSSYYQSYPRKSSSLMNLCGSSCDQDSLTYNSRYMTDTDSGLGLLTPPHRTSSPAPNTSSPSGPGSLPPSHHSRRLRYDDTASESGGSEYSGPRLYKQPTVKSNRGIIMNAIEYCVFPGEVNRAKRRSLVDEINRSDGGSTKHFLILFRDAGCQYRALYSYFPESEEVTKVSGVGPKLVTEDMFDKFFKYNSGSKCFAQVHTKHLTVTIDAFTIHNNLWQGKKVNLPSKRDMALVI